MMLSVDDALRAVLENARALKSVHVTLQGALGAALAEDVVADLDSPPFDKALMDGYAVRAADTAGQCDQSYRSGSLDLLMDGND